MSRRSSHDGLRQTDETVRQKWQRVRVSLMRSRLKILFISFNQAWQGGGTFFRALGFARHLVTRGHRVTLLATSRHNRLHFQRQTVDGVQLLQAPAMFGGMLRSGWDPYEVFRRRLILRNEHFDVVHAFESRPIVIYPALAVQRRCQATLFLDWCDWFGAGGHVEERAWWLRPWLRPIETYYEEHFRHRAAGTTVINTALRQRAVKLGVSPEAILWLPNGAETEALRRLPRDEARKALGLAEEQVLVGHLGQAFPPDAQLLFESFAHLKQRRPEARLLLMGNHTMDLNAFPLAQTDLVDVGYVEREKLNLYLGACDLVWLPLVNTGRNRGRFPMKINDYMSAGRATVGTAVGDMAQLFQGARPIGRVAPDDPEAFAVATDDLLADTEARTCYEQNARLVAETEFAWPSVTERLEAFYFAMREIS